MDRGAVEEFVASAALLGAHLSRQCETACTTLQESTTRFARTVDEGQALIAESTRTMVREALACEIPAVVEGLGEGTRQLQAMVERSLRAQAALERRSRRVGATAIAAMLVASLLVLGGTGYVASQNIARSKDAQVRLEVMQALEQVTITSCDGRPCLKLEDGLPRWARNDAYVLVDRDPPTDPASR